MNKSLLYVCIAIFLLSGCIFKHESPDAGTVNLFEYYLYSDKYEYTVTKEVETTTIVPTTELIPGDILEFYSFSESLTDGTTSHGTKTITIEKTLNSNGEFTTGSRGEHSNSYPLVDDHPSPFLGIVMDDSSIWFRDTFYNTLDLDNLRDSNLRIHSSKLGKVISVHDLNSTVLISKNNQRVDIGYQLREFLAKEKALEN